MFVGYPIMVLPWQLPTPSVRGQLFRSETHWDPVRSDHVPWLPLRGVGDRCTKIGGQYRGDLIGGL